MTSIILRVDTPGGLTNAQLDANFRNLNNDKVEVSYLNSLLNTGAVASTVVMRDTNGDTISRTLKSTIPNTVTISGAIAWRDTADNTNNGLQFCSDKTAIRQFLGVNDVAPLSHVGTGGSAHAIATTSVSGFMSSSDKTKLNDIADNANNYIHPTTDGNLHVPVTGTTNSGKVLMAGASAGSFSWQALTKTNFGLGNVDNTSDVNKPISTATQTALNAKLNSSNGLASNLTLNDGYTEEVFVVSGTAPVLSPTNGSIQTWVLSGNSTPTLGTWASGQSIMLGVDDGSAATITWPTITWTVSTEAAPTLATSGLTWISLWKVGTTIYGKY